MKKELKADVFLKYTLFVLNPILGALYALKRVNTRSSFSVFFLFFLCFGIAFSPESESYLGDGKHYMDAFKFYYNYPSYKFYTDFELFLRFDDGKKDFYVDTLYYFVGKYTDNYHYLFLIFSVVFGFFSLKCLKYFVAEFDKWSIPIIILFYIFTINQIFNINGVRFWTAAWIAIFIVFKVIKDQDYRFLFLLLLLPFIHGSYWIFIGLIISSFLLMRFDKLMSYIFISSIVFSNISLELARNNIDILPVFLQRGLSFYVEQNYIEEVNKVGSGFSQLAIYFKNGLVLYMNLLISIFIYNSQLVKSNIKTKRIYQFILLLGSFANFTMSIPSLGSRYFLLLYPLIAYIYIVNFLGSKYDRFLYLFPLLYIFTFKELLYNYIDTTGVYLYISNPFYLIYEYLL